MCALVTGVQTCALPISRVPVIGILIAVVLYWIALSVPVVTVAIPFLLLAPAFQNSYMGQSIAMVQSVAPNNMRATAAAMFIFANSLIGFGLGPPLFGLLSDFFAASGMAQAGIDTAVCAANPQLDRSEEHTSDLQSLMRISSAVL